MKPFTDNIIFFDTEFSTLDPYNGEILSIGLVKLSGEELYLELEYDGPASDWVKGNILPTLKAPKISRDEAKRKMKEFVGNGMPYMVAYINQYDDVYLNKLFLGDEKPFYWLPIDFASMMFAVGLNPESRITEDFPGYQQHNALDDARLLRDWYLKFFERYKSD